MPRFDAYVICTSPRSGSTLLCDLLKSTGVAGNPASWFHTASVADWLQPFDLAIDDSLSDKDNLARAFGVVISAGSLDHGLFALRMQRHSVDFFMRQLAILQPGLSNDTERLNAAFGRTGFIHLTRRDKVSQAVSMVKAEQTGLWHRAADGRELERLSPPAPAEYDTGRIATALAQMQQWDLEWTQWFARESIEPFQIEYEALASDASAVLHRVLTDLGIDSVHAAGIVPGVAKLADDSSELWVERFVAEFGDGLRLL
jgi:LPS sulfotransferase NodH